MLPEGIPEIIKRTPFGYHPEKGVESDELKTSKKEIPSLDFSIQSQLSLRNSLEPNTSRLETGTISKSALCVLLFFTFQ